MWAFFCMPFFAVGLYTFTARGTTFTANACGIVGLLSTAALAAALSIANGIETFTFVNTGNLSERPEIFLLLRSLSRVLFRAAEVFTPAMMAGFSLAGWRSGAMPRWLVALGLIGAAAWLLIGVGMASALSGGWAAKLRLVAEPVVLVWSLCTGVLMVRRA